MALHFSLLASVAAIMTWVIRTENGGLLNVLFRIVPSATHRDHQHDHQHDHDVHFELINQVDAAVVDFFKQMLLLKPLPLPILQVMPESLGGGQSGVDNAHANPNRGADIFWITVFTFLLVTGLIILTQVINCWCYKRRDMHGLTNALQMAVLRANITNKQFILRIVYIAVLLLTLVFLAISIILVIVYISSTGLVVSYLATQPQAAETTKVRLEVERQYDNLVTNLITYMRVDGEKTFTKLTGSLFPCVEAHAAYSAAIGVTCGETGGVRLLLGLSYVLALNVLFLTLLYFALFSLAFCQALQIRMLDDVIAADCYNNRNNYKNRDNDDDFKFGSESY
ncbi:hypothetical protein TcWFU_010304 [Taenia crassiceps]|uniref:Uncharacterized protein n=1 Tax=Taenia crassiceps TaxID=6207 RepID=A0ABR4Q384_9CEST